jgi:GntR family transcriptional regulator, arabinose operon transcriptional repressor
VSETSCQPLYLTIADRLRHAIYRRRLTPGLLLDTENALARHYHASRVSVRKATDVLIREGLIERRAGKGIFVAHTNPIALRPKAAIQMVFGDLNRPTSLLISRGAQLAAIDSHAQVEIRDGRGVLEASITILHELPRSNAGGAIILDLQSPKLSEALYALKSSRFPFVLIDPHRHELKAPSVVSDNYDGGRKAGNHLLTLGHRRIAFMGDLASAIVQDRLAGFRDAIGDAGLVFNRTHVVDVGHDDTFSDRMASISAHTHRLLSTPEPPTAIFASCDAIACSVIRAMAEVGLRAPAGVSVLGFDDDPMAQSFTPRLTTVRQDFELLGRTAFKVLHTMMHRATTVAMRSIVPITLIQRESVGPVSGPWTSNT